MKYHFDGNFEDQPINVKKFGAKADGTTNDAAAIQAAVDAAFNAGGGTVYMPYSSAGYVINSQIRWKSDVNLIAEGSLITTASVATTLIVFYLPDCVNVKFTGRIRVKSTNNRTRTITDDGGSTTRAGQGSNVQAVYIGGNCQNVNIEYVYGECMENVVNIQGTDPSTSKNLFIKEIESLDSYQPFYIGNFSRVTIDYIQANVVSITMDPHDHIVYISDKSHDLTIGTVRGSNASAVAVWAVQIYPGDVNDATRTIKRTTINTIKLDGCWSGFVGTLCEGAWIGELNCNLTNGGTILGAYNSGKYEVGNVTVEGTFTHFLMCDGGASTPNQLTIHGGKVNANIVNANNNYMLRGDYIDKLTISNVEFNNITSAYTTFYVPSGTTDQITFSNCVFIFKTNFITDHTFSIGAGTTKFKDCEFINKATLYDQIIGCWTPANVKVYRCIMTNFKKFLYAGADGTGRVFSSILNDDNTIINGTINNEVKSFPNMLTSLPTAGVAYRGSQTVIQGAVGVAEVITLNVTNRATTNGNVTITLDGTPFTVAVLSTDSTTALVATKLRAATYVGWTTSGSTSNVIFTSTSTGARTDGVFAAGGTGVTATISTTTQGITAVPDKKYTCLMLADGNYDWVE